MVNVSSVLFILFIDGRTGTSKGGKCSHVVALRLLPPHDSISVSRNKKHLNVITNKCIALTRWSRGIFEKLMVVQLIKMSSSSCNTRRFSRTFARARHCTLS
jgi:hypothetical protein